MQVIIFSKEKSVVRYIKIVYIDSTFLYNCALDFLLLYMTSRIMTIKAKTKNLILGASVGALFAALCEVFEISPIIKLFLAALTAFIMSRICFGKRNKKVYIRTVLIMILCSCALFGFLYVLKNFFISLFKNTSLVNVGMPLWLFVVISGAVSAFLTCILRWSHTKSNQKSVTLKMTVLGQTNTFNLLCDSGNLATDKLSGNPVVIVSQKLLNEKYEILSKNLKNGFDTQTARQIFLHFVPLKTIENVAFCMCFKPDSCFVVLDNTCVEIDICVAIDFKDDGFCGYEGIFPTKCLDAVI